MQTFLFNDAWKSCHFHFLRKQISRNLSWRLSKEHLKQRSNGICYQQESRLSSDAFASNTVRVIYSSDPFTRKRTFSRPSHVRGWGVGEGHTAIIPWSKAEFSFEPFWRNIQSSPYISLSVICTPWQRTGPSKRQITAWYPLYIRSIWRRTRFEHQCSFSFISEQFYKICV